ncbi:MAG TPA: hypothetical protein VEK39_11760 [Solirubrobacterales bacterium]|nr:hypothetical protein [Solirubrobacterales bacterium]
MEISQGDVTVTQAPTQELPRVAPPPPTDAFGARLGLSVPNEWWPSAPLLKSFEAGGFGGLDPLRLDLHLPPGRGTLPWQEIAPRLVGHSAPLLLEVHPPYRPAAGELHRATRELLAPQLAAAA